MNSRGRRIETIGARRPAASKVAPVTFSFWVMKICATTLGETAGDLFSMTLKMGYALSSVLLFSLFAVSLVAQLRSKHFYPLIYWLVILTTSTAGTTLSDFMDRTLGLGYAKGTLILFSVLIIILLTWLSVEKNLSVSNIHTQRAEGFYWLAILISNTLGTAFGDYLADSSRLGFFGGAVLIGCLLTLIVLLMYATRISRILLFWLAFVLTRPFGATFGDLLTKPSIKGGLAFGTVGSSLVLGVLLAVMVVHSTWKRNQRLGCVS